MQRKVTITKKNRQGLVDLNSTYPQVVRRLTGEDKLAAGDCSFANIHCVYTDKDCPRCGFRVEELLSDGPGFRRRRRHG